ncbi:MAG TPA: amidohydrolase family protein [Thermomicrobiales bacterium]|nr:amidohydrolase family protein [Thermomicrobiales bacterium]
MRTAFSVIDTDIHCSYDERRMLDFLPEPWRTRYASGNRGPGVLGYWNPNGVMRSDAVTDDGIRIESRPETLARDYFDVYNIEFGILNSEKSLHVGLSPEPDFSAAVVSAINDIVVNDWLPVDPRFRASIIISTGDPELAAKEIHRLGDHPGVVQVLMGSGARMPYGQRYFHPIYAAAVEYDLPVAIHPGNEGSGVSGSPTAAGYPSSYLEWHTNLVGSYIAHLVSLVSEGVFIKYPTLKFVMVEGGMAWLPPILWRFDKNWKALRQTTPWLERPPSEYVRDHILLTTQPIEEPPRSEELRAMFEMFDVERMVMFSSDFPHWDGDTPDFAARAFSATARPRVMSETARELYKLPPASPVDQQDIIAASEAAARS